MNKKSILILSVSLLVVCSFSSFKAFAEEIGEEGPPQEAPFIEEPDLEELMDEPATSAETSEPETERPSVLPVLEDEPEIVATPTVENKPAYVVPKKPTTQAGRLRGSEKISHPQSAKGLLEIQKDGSYIYDPIKTKARNVTAAARIGQINPPPQIEGSTSAISFETVYGSGNPAQFSFDYEWYPFADFGKLGLQGGFGIFKVQGNGRFVKDGTEAKEKYDFYGIPLSLGVIYRLQLSDTSWLAPYVAGGGSFYGLAEKRDDDDPWNFAGVAAGYGTGGVLINISKFDHQTAFNLSNEYGIQNIWLSFEAKAVGALNKNLDVSATVFSGGLVLDY